MRTLLVILTVLATSASAVQRGQERIYAYIMFEQAEIRLAYIEQILRDSLEYLTENPSDGSLRGHAALRYIAGNRKDFRSILAFNEEGTLLFDSFNRIRLLSTDLSDRQYFIDGIAADPDVPEIHDLVYGRQSGLPFLPISMTGSLPDGSRRMAVVTFLGSALFPSIDLCAECGLAIARGDRVLISRTGSAGVEMSNAPSQLFSLDSGREPGMIDGLPATIHWKNSEVTDLSYVFYRVATSEVAQE